MRRKEHLLRRVFIFDRYRTIFPSGVFLFLQRSSMSTKLRDPICDDIRFPRCILFFSTWIRNFTLDRSARESLIYCRHKSNFPINKR